METSPSTTLGPEAWAERLATSLHAQRARAGGLLAAQRTRIEQAETFIQQEFERLQNQLDEQREEADRIRNERDTLAAQLAEGQQQAAEVPSSGDGRAVDEDIQQRYEMAMDDVRQLQEDNSELQQQLLHARSAAATLAQQSHPPGTLDWEAEKQRVLAALEADSDEGDETRKTEHLKIADVLKTTSDALAAKDREIQELQRLQQLGANGAAEVANAVSVDRVLNNDAVVWQERERLREMQEQWQDKLRQAEVDLALERADIARQRAKLEAQSRAAQDASSESHDATNDDRQADSSVHGRWLARLGLTAADREPGRPSK